MLSIVHGIRVRADILGTFHVPSAMGDAIQRVSRHRRPELYLARPGLLPRRTDLCSDQRSNLPPIQERKQRHWQARIPSPSDDTRCDLGSDRSLLVWMVRASTYSLDHAEHRRLYLCRGNDHLVPVHPDLHCGRVHSFCGKWDSSSDCAEEFGWFRVSTFCALYVPGIRLWMGK